MDTTQSFTSQMNVAENANSSNSYELIKRIPAGMFTIVGNEHENKYMICLGAYRLTERELTIEEAHEKINNRDYQLLLSIASVVAENVYREMRGKELEQEITTKKPSRAK